MPDQRQQNLKTWIESTLGQSVSLKPMMGDASFRRYFRLSDNGTSLLAMDAPPEKESCEPFVKLAHRLKAAGLNVPQIFEQNIQEGYLLISDFGHQLYYHSLSTENVNELYRLALNDLIKIQCAYKKENETLPAFDWHTIKTELHAFTHWFLEKYLEVSLSTKTVTLLENTYRFLLDNAVTQPQTFVHRDYHSRNLMILPDQQVGILDFQDAVIGPITYDLVSLIRDCYIDWPKNQVEQWTKDFYHSLVKASLLPTDVNEALFLRWFDLMGMQRHLKAIFIFARKSLRDNDHQYLQFIPRALSYIDDISKNYPELSAFHHFLHEFILPCWKQKEVLA